MMSKVQEHHLARSAYVYIRQSTPGQVLHHQESTARQYALRDKAEQMQWAGATIQILDQDLGQSGQHATGRQDFKRLVSDVSMGRVGAIFALEASRLARSDLDWHRLIEICSITSTLVVDEDGCYDPGDFNDALLLGLKATIAKAELHFIRARLLGGKLNKAKRGELRFPLPVGYCYDDVGQIELDPDQQVQSAVRLVFRLFQGSFQDAAPRCAQGAPQWRSRDCRVVPPTRSAILENRSMKQECPSSIRLVLVSALLTNHGTCPWGSAYNDTARRNYVFATNGQAH